LTTGIIAKILHEPTVRLKEYAGQDPGCLYAEALQELFCLDCGSSPIGSTPLVEAN